MSLLKYAQCLLFVQRCLQVWTVPPDLVVRNCFACINVSFKNSFNFWLGGWIDSQKYRSKLPHLSTPKKTVVLKDGIHRAHKCADWTITWHGTAFATLQIAPLSGASLHRQAGCRDSGYLSSLIKAVIYRSLARGPREPPALWPWYRPQVKVFRLSEMKYLKIHLFFNKFVKLRFRATPGKVNFQTCFAIVQNLNYHASISFFARLFRWNCCCMHEHHLSLFWWGRKLNKQLNESCIFFGSSRIDCLRST